MISRNRQAQVVVAINRESIHQRLLALREELKKKIAALVNKQRALAREKSGDDQVDNELIVLQRRMKKVGWKIILLERTTSKVYDGMVCLKCGRPIELKWLEKSPEARFCLTCQRTLESRLFYVVKLGNQEFRMNFAIEA